MPGIPPTTPPSSSATTPPAAPSKRKPKILFSQHDDVLLEFLKHSQEDAFDSFMEIMRAEFAATVEAKRERHLRVLRSLR